MKTDGIGIYIHIPFCVSKCAYCDFCSFPSRSLDVGKREAYIDALLVEIDSYKGLGLSADTVFIGGGTPSLLKPRELLKIREHIDNSFTLAQDAEFTMEVNPKTGLGDNISAYRAAGVNRISIGLQSIHQNELNLLGRIHSYEDFLDTYNAARSAGINNVNVDLMYGIPEQTAQSFEQTLSAVLSLNPQHISLYGLILEENTPFFDIKDSLPLPSEEGECDMYYFAARRLSDAGYNHYEISNYAKPGLECKHNLKYWQCKEYIGLGLSAHSYFNGTRFANTNLLEDYITKRNVRIKSDRLTQEDARFEYAMLHLRLFDGFSVSEYKRLFDEDFLLPRRELLEQLSNGGYLNLEGDRISLTETGFYVSNYILSELL